MKRVNRAGFTHAFLFFGLEQLGVMFKGGVMRLEGEVLEEAYV